MASIALVAPLISSMEAKSVDKLQSLTDHNDVWTIISNGLTSSDYQQKRKLLPVWAVEECKIYSQLQDLLSFQAILIILGPEIPHASSSHGRQVIHSM